MPIDGIPAPKVEGQGTVRFRCVACHGLIDKPLWLDGQPFHPDCLDD